MQFFHIGYKRLNRTSRDFCRGSSCRSAADQATDAVREFLQDIGEKAKAP
jgi:hypothetical protein